MTSPSLSAGSFLNQGWHPNDLSRDWLGGIPGLESRVIFDFFNGFATAAAPLMHSVNRLELLGRASSGYFLFTFLEKGQLQSGPVLVMRVTTRAPLGEEDEEYREVPKRRSETTREWLERGYAVLLTLATPARISLPPDPAAWFGDDVTPSPEQPPDIMEYEGS